VLGKHKQACARTLHRWCSECICDCMHSLSHTFSPQLSAQSSSASPFSPSPIPEHSSEHDGSAAVSMSRLSYTPSPSATSIGALAPNYKAVAIAKNLLIRTQVHQKDDSSSGPYPGLAANSSHAPNHYHSNPYAFNESASQPFSADPRPSAGLHQQQQYSYKTQHLNVNSPSQSVCSPMSAGATFAFSGLQISSAHQHLSSASSPQPSPHSAGSYPNSPYSGHSQGGRALSPGRRVRRRVKTACTNCKNAKTKCDMGRPCLRCVRRKQPELCRDSVHKRRSRRATESAVGSPGRSSILYSPRCR